MRGYLTVLGEDSGRLTVDSRVELYRDPEGSHRVYARKEGGKHDLGISDVTVSRLQNETPPVAIESRQSCIEIHNRRNSNGVTVTSDGGEVELAKGETKLIKNTVTIDIGYQTTLHMKVEREAKQEINVGGDVRGDLVAGDQRNVDDRTQVVDSVVNRSNISGEAATVEDSVVNRSQVGDEPRETAPDESDTQTHCKRHDRMYTGEVCPECAADATRTSETKFCRFCAAEIPAEATVCPDCGDRLSGSS
jgi:hypothetical protein